MLISAFHFLFLQSFQGSQGRAYLFNSVWVFSRLLLFLTLIITWILVLSCFPLTWFFKNWLEPSCSSIIRSWKSSENLLGVAESYSHTCERSIHTRCCFWLCLRVNVGCGPAEERVLLTGLHAVADIYCENCKTTLGWKYVSSLGSFWFTDPPAPSKDREWPSGGRGGAVAQ